MTGKVIVGKIVRQFKNCACGKTKDGFCKECETEAVDIVAIKHIENEQILTEEWLANNK